MRQAGRVSSWSPLGPGHTDVAGHSLLSVCRLSACAEGQRQPEEMHLLGAGLDTSARCLIILSWFTQMK